MDGIRQGGRETWNDLPMGQQPSAWRSRKATSLQTGGQGAYVSFDPLTETFKFLRVPVSNLSGDITSHPLSFSLFYLSLAPIAGPPLPLLTGPPPLPDLHHSKFNTHLPNWKLGHAYKDTRPSMWRLSSWAWIISFSIFSSSVFLQISFSFTA